MKIALLSPDQPDWVTKIDALWTKLRPLHGKFLLPRHFVTSALTRIGGQVICIYAANEQTLMGVGFLLPRAGSSYIMRYHLLTEHNADFLQAIKERVAIRLEADVHLYDPAAPQFYTPTYQQYGEINIGHPDADEAEEIRALQQNVWGATADYLYPSDLHSDGFGLGKSLVARIDGKLAGYLFGFHRKGGPALPSSWRGQYNEKWRLESQLMAVAPEHRGKRLGYLLKMVQAEMARAQGLDIIHWTTDPLLYPNAVLNFGLLRAVAFDFKADLYPFRNALNQVPASRFQLTWPITADEVCSLDIRMDKPTVIDLSQRPEIERVNQRHLAPDLVATARRIAIEIPRDWQAFQLASLNAALQWRTTTDLLFDHYLGIEPNSYIIRDVGRDGERSFLVAERNIVLENNIF